LTHPNPDLLSASGAADENANRAYLFAYLKWITVNSVIRFALSVFDKLSIIGNFTCVKLVMS